MNVEVTLLPGIGVRKDFALASGRRIGVITRKDGANELIVSRKDDPDATQASITLSNEGCRTSHPAMTPTRRMRQPVKHRLQIKFMPLFCPDVHILT